MADARVELRPTRAVTVALDVQNLTDRRGAVDYMQYPLPGRAVYGTLRVAM
jgi:outer membrane receptor protein involved in Fe transport